MLTLFYVNHLWIWIVPHNFELPKTHNKKINRGHNIYLRKYKSIRLATSNGCSTSLIFKAWAYFVYNGMPRTCLCNLSFPSFKWWKFFVVIFCTLIYKKLWLGNKKIWVCYNTHRLSLTILMHLCTQSRTLQKIYQYVRYRGSFPMELY